MTDADRCADGRAHDFGPPREAVADHGPMEGRWLVCSCRGCNAFTLRSVDDPRGSLTALLGKLSSLDCDPRLT